MIRVVSISSISYLPSEFEPL